MKHDSINAKIRAMLENYMTVRIRRDTVLHYTIRRGFINVFIFDTLLPEVGFNSKNSPRLEEAGVTREQLLAWLEKNAKNVTKPIKHEKPNYSIYD